MAKSSVVTADAVIGPESSDAARMIPIRMRQVIGFHSPTFSRSSSNWHTDLPVAQHTLCRPLLRRRYGLLLFETLDPPEDLEHDLILVLEMMENCLDLRLGFEIDLVIRFGA